MLASVPLFEEIDRHVDGNRVNPGVKARFALKITDRPIGLGKDILKQIIGILMIGGHVIDQTIDSWRIPDHKLVEGAWVPALSPGDQFLVVIGGDLLLVTHW